MNTFNMTPQEVRTPSPTRPSHDTVHHSLHFELLRPVAEGEDQNDLPLSVVAITEEEFRMFRQVLVYGDTTGLFDPERLSGYLTYEDFTNLGCYDEVADEYGNEHMYVGTVLIEALTDGAVAICGKPINIQDKEKLIEILEG